MKKFHSSTSSALHILKCAGEESRYTYTQYAEVHMGKAEIIIIEPIVTVISEPTKKYR